MSNKIKLTTCSSNALLSIANEGALFRLGLLSSSILDESKFACAGIILSFDSMSYFIFPMQEDILSTDEYPESYFQSIVGFSVQTPESLNSKNLEFVWEAGRWILIDPGPVYWLDMKTEHNFIISRIITQYQIRDGRVIEFILRLDIASPSGCGFLIEAATYSPSIIIVSLSDAQYS